MGLHERDYARQSRGRGSSARPPMGGGFGGLPSVVKWLLIINGIVFLADAILTGSQRASHLSPFLWGFFSFDAAVTELQLWRWVTYQFLHGDFLHLLFNMIGLYFFGPMMERWWGSKRFMVFYLLSGISGAIVYTALLPTFGFVSTGVPLVGASGSIFGIRAGGALVAPDRVVHLIIPPMPMKMRTMVLLLLCVGALGVIAGSSNAGGDAAHLGGAAMGFMLVKFSRMLDWVDPKATRKRKPKDRTSKIDKQVDRILIKVKEQGLHSLTKEEQQVLSRASESKRAG